MSKKFALLISVLMLSTSILWGCTSKGESVLKDSAVEEAGAVNVYTDRHYDTDQELYKIFEEETGINVNVVEGKSDELIERLSREGENTQADVLIAADAGRLYRAKEKGLLKSVESDILSSNVPSNLTDVDNEWFGLTVRGRVIVYSKDRVNPSELSSYADLTDPKWKGKILVRSSSNIYNQSLLASLIEQEGAGYAKEWAEGIVNNMARDPEGNDRDQAKAVVAGMGDIAIMNTYYVGKLINSSDPEEVKVGEQVGVFFPDQDGKGTHINVSGAGVIKHSKNAKNAVKFIEFMSDKKAQGMFAQANYEYPVKPDVEPSELLKSWGEFETQDINLSKLGENNKAAVEIFNQVGWK
ncbi:iron(III) transport system substrate-binding protein [Peptoclostridium litorale DSM 5388]|uniref:Iron uptake protein A1 n=1 Tax=Peptoclostridium litorale DSM 5388 TaxID=1121324 RepID=A0A069RIC0_PEPLI|nr:Fe(3+) ABC transporter substrate-binding protein [Peptoclostridium litorale]KDR96774.1 iron uptake protein A1 [Peptoclostridium litorale DSM 5388]SIO34545.1 iron(III) transport system substrate-binding protein [Peptoclostridium litorale DSM 5388]